MSNKKKKIITSTEKDAPTLHVILMAFTLCMSLVSVLFLFTITLFLATGEENIYLHKIISSLLLII